jgi:hypothetical protein
VSVSKNGEKNSSDEKKTGVLAQSSRKSMLTKSGRDWIGNVHNNNIDAPLSDGDWRN